MKKTLAFALTWAFLLSLVGCGQAAETLQDNENVQYFFSGKVMEADEESLLMEVTNPGNTNLSDGAEVEVSTEVVSASGCPLFAAGEYARVVMARNTDDTSDRLEALAIYRTDETGMTIEDS